MFQSILISTVCLFLLLPQETQEHSFLYQNINVSGVCLGDHVSDIYKLERKPDSIVFYQSDIIEADSARYFYFGASFYEVSDNRVLRFEILDKNLRCDYPNITYGEEIQKVLNRYPLIAFKKYRPETKRDHWIYANWVNGFDGAIMIHVEKQKIVEVEFYVPY